MAVSPETPTALAGLPCQRGVTPLDSPLPTRPACRQWGLRPPSERLFAVPAPIRLAMPSSALPRRASAPPSLRPVHLTIAKAYQVLLFSTRQTAPLTHCITFDSYKELDAVKPAERQARFTTKRKRCHYIVHSLFAPQNLPLSKNIIYQASTVNFVDAASRNLFTEELIDLDSRFPQGIILCYGAVLCVLVQMVSGKKAL